VSDLDLFYVKAEKERDLQSDIINHAHIRGWFCQKVQFVGRRGCQDVVAIRGGRTVWIEVKKPGKVPTKQQALVAREMKDKGAEVYAVDNLIDAKAILK
jgi:hypothetical protein